jgi:hypothetical protein
MAPDTVLILTHSADRFVIERVVAGLEREGVRALRFDTDLFPTEVRLATRLDGRTERAGLRCGRLALDQERVRAVWARKIWRHRLPDDLDPALRAGSERESRAALLGWLSGLTGESGVRWVNPLAPQAAAEDKPRQLRAAAALGLAVPLTLVTNDPAEVRAFHAELAGRPMVAKMLTPLSVSMDKAELFVHTSRVRAEDLAELESLRLSPMVFQEELEKQVELRVAVVGARCFVGAIDASGSAAGQVDWRRAGPGEARWTRGELPDDVAARLVRLVAALGLVYGAADLVVTPAGEHVFLELNPAGEWGMLERDLDLPIGAALAQELLRP